MFSLIIFFVGCEDESVAVDNQAQPNIPESAEPIIEGRRVYISGFYQDYICMQMEL